MNTKPMPIIYIAGPFRAANAWLVEQNIRRAENLAIQVATLGAMPLCPHTNSRFFDGTIDGSFWVGGTLELLRRCDAVLFTPCWMKSAGARGEHAEAERLGIARFYTITELADWLLPPTERAERMAALVDGLSHAGATP